MIYDGRVPPDQKDSPKKARLDYFKYTDYPDKWDELADRFSQDAVASGAFDKYAEESALFKASTPVDAAFLTVISEWREKLARNIAQNNSSLTPRQLNNAVQMIIDRIIFLRICEDRGIETVDRLRGVTPGNGTYARLVKLFQKADERYNSGLFADLHRGLYCSSDGWKIGRGQDAEASFLIACSRSGLWLRFISHWCLPVSAFC